MSGEDKVDSSGNVLTSYTSSIVYTTAGQVSSMVDGSGVTENFTYSNDRLQLTRQTATKGASTLMDLNYNYSATAGASGAQTTAGNSGQLMAIGNNPSSQPSKINGQTRTQAFTYDDLGRLTTATGWSTWQRRYSYDRWGNRTGMWDATSGGNQIQSVTLAQSGGAPTNRATTITNSGMALTQTYDAAGNLTNDGMHSYQYDAENRIAKVDAGTLNESVYFYDAGNRRAKRTGLNGAYTTYSIWEGGQVIAEYSNAPTGSSGNSYYLADRLSNRMITDNSGAFKGTQDHLPFGDDAGTTGVTEKHRFTNYERDAESNTDYAMNRQYGMNNGRYKQPDILAGSLLDPQSLNRYAYSLNDPVNVADPSGLFPDVPEQFNAAYSGPGVYWDGIRLMITEYEMVYRFWQSGAVDIIPDGAVRNSRGEWLIPSEDMFVSDWNDLWRLLPLSLASQPNKGGSACDAMARRAQRIADAAQFQLGNNQAAVEEFDRNFSQAYLGNNGIGKTYKSAWDFFGAWIRAQVPAADLGDSGFKREFQDHEGDQTHHFAAYLSAGINGQTLAASGHMLTDLTNKADRQLGSAAYKLGERLTANPTNLVTIGYRIQNDICK